MAKLLLIVATLVGFVNSMIERSQQQLLIDDAPASSTPLDAQP